MPPTKKKAIDRAKKNRRIQAAKRASNMGANLSAVERASLKYGSTVKQGPAKKKKATKRRKSR